MTANLQKSFPEWLVVVCSAGVVAILVGIAAAVGVVHAFVWVALASPVVVLMQLVYLFRGRPIHRLALRALAGTIAFVMLTCTLCLAAYGVADFFWERQTARDLKNPLIRCFPTEYRKCP